MEAVLEQPRKVGRPSSYKPEFATLATKLCLLGATDKEMAQAFEVSEQTLNAWKQEFPEFLEALKDGKERADATVGERLYQRATGYSHPDVHISQYEGHVIVTPIIKHYPPDTTACIFWLKNRDPDNWRDVKNMELSGIGGKPIEIVHASADALKAELLKRGAITLPN